MKVTAQAELGRVAHELLQLPQFSLQGVDAGAVVIEVEDGSMAGNAGFQKGDLLVEVNGTKVATTREAKTALSDKARLWKIVINRGGQLLATVFQG